jgi:hypothetical protein
MLFKQTATPLKFLARKTPSLLGLRSHLFRHGDVLTKGR